MLEQFSSSKIRSSRLFFSGLDSRRVQKERATRGKKAETIKSERDGGGSKVTSRFLLTRDTFSLSRHQIVFLDAVLRAFGVKGMS